MPNLLLTSAGRRGVLIRIFQRELKAVFADAKVFAADLRPELSSACQLADGSFQVPRVTAEDYIPRLIELCKANGITLIIPTIDPELQVLAESRERLAEHGITPLISDFQLVQICRDKRLTHDFFVEHGLDVPGIVDPTTIGRFPLFAKPYDGSSSLNTYVIWSADDLTPTLLANPKLIYLDYLSPTEYDEYTVDMYYDRTGELKCLVPRLRLETRAGEVSKGRTAWLPSFKSLREGMGRIETARGCLTVQVFVKRSTGEVFGIEINPRFGGGYPLSYDAGANFPKWVIEEYLLGRAIDWFDDWELNLTMLRYDDHVLVRG